MLISEEVLRSLTKNLLTSRDGANFKCLAFFDHPLAPAFVVALGAIFVAAGGFWAASRKSGFNAELREKNEEIARLQKANTGAITGGDSFC